MIYVTGDIHGDLTHLKTCVLPFAKSFHPNDLLIVAGDFGFFYPPETPDPRFSKMQSDTALGLALLHALPCPVAFIDGNHENFPRINRFPIVSWNGGLVHWMSPRLVHLIRGNTYTLQGKRIAVLGGGLSIDKAMRREGLTWWPEELPSADELHRFRTIFTGENAVDAVITHAAPLHIMQRLGYHPGEELMLDTVLEEAYLTHQWRTWFFGHLHLDSDEGNGLYAMYCTIRTLDGALLTLPKETSDDV